MNIRVIGKTFFSLIALAAANLCTAGGESAEPFFGRPGVLITDLAGSVAEPEKLFKGEEVPKNRWQIFDYETMNGVKGNFLYCTALSEPGELSFEIPVEGWHRIFIGQASRAGGALMMSLGIQLRLEEDPAFTRLCGSGINWFWEMTDSFWKEAELTRGSRLIVRRPPFQQGSIAWIRFEPMTEAEIASAVKRQEKSNPHWNAATNDGYWPNTLEDFYNEIESYSGSNVRKLFFLLATGDVVSLYDTRVGTVQAYKDVDFERDIDRDILLKMQELREKHPDAVARLAEFAHSRKLEFHASARMGAWHYPGGVGNSRFFLENPQWHCRNQDGTWVDKMSMAAPEVREHWLALFEEMLQYEVDGVHLIFIRALPNMLFEEPFLAQFRAEYPDVDPATIEEFDPRVTALRGKIMTGFIRDLRSLLDRVGAERGRRLELSLTVPATGELNRNHGLMLEEWCQAGLIDLITVDGSMQTRSHQESVNNIEFEYFQKAVANSSCQWLAKLPGIWDGTDHLAYYRKALSHGAAGVLLWDGAHNFTPYPYGWESLRLLGSGADGSEEAQTWLQARPQEERVILIRTLNGFDYDRYPAHVAY